MYIVCGATLFKLHVPEAKVCTVCDATLFKLHVPEAKVCTECVMLLYLSYMYLK